MAGSSDKKQLVQDEAICLARRDFSESSLVLVMLCRSVGKVSLLAKGARRPKSAVAVDLLDRGEASLILSVEGLGLLREFACTAPLPELRRDLHKWHVGLYLSEIANLATKDLAPAGRLFDLLVNSLERTCRAGSSKELAAVLVHGTKGILAWAGYDPQLQNCVSCNRVLTPADLLFFTASGGGLLCRDCEPAVVDKVRLEHRAWYYLLGKVDDTVSARMGFELLNYMIREHLGRPAKMEKHCGEIFGGKQVSSFQRSALSDQVSARPRNQE